MGPGTSKRCGQKPFNHPVCPSGPLPWLWPSPDGTHSCKGGTLPTHPDSGARRSSRRSAAPESLGFLVRHRSALTKLLPFKVFLGDLNRTRAFPYDRPTPTFSPLVQLRTWEIFMSDHDVPACVPCDRGFSTPVAVLGAL